MFLESSPLEVRFFIGSAIFAALCALWLRILWGYACDFRRAAHMRSLLVEMEYEFRAEACGLYDAYEDGRMTFDELGEREEFLRALYMKMANDLEERFRVGLKKGRVRAK